MWGYFGWGGPARGGLGGDAPRRVDRIGRVEGHVEARQRAGRPHLAPPHRTGDIELELALPSVEDLACLGQVDRLGRDDDVAEVVGRIRNGRRG